MNKTDLFNYLGAPLSNPRWSWGARRAKDGAIFLFAWQDESKRIEGKRYTLVDNATYFGEAVGLGRAERLEHIELIRAGGPSFMVMGRAVDRNVSPRVIASIDQNDVFVGGELKVLSGDTYLEWVTRRPIATVR
jgi:putative restriction endonuclease